MQLHWQQLVILMLLCGSLEIITHFFISKHSEILLTQLICQRESREGFFEHFILRLPQCLVPFGSWPAASKR